ncbi:RcnB family protein [Dyella sp.]|uniref:RcnB family protein n=1 Tax=Dyella sp. TaxID=1869338 RepID=UPI002D7711C2|nr:RcnB family protein [Dyella sp.]HET7329795.1 RcnB family protein [Dyella sp.]
MKRHLLALALLSAVPMVMVSTAAVAQGRGHDHDQGWQDDDHGHGHGHGHDRDDRGWHDDDHHDHGRHLGWDKHYRRGEYLPERYRVREYYVEDYGRYRLRPPPPGYGWYRSDDGEYVLVAIATGLIVQELLGQ